MVPGPPYRTARRRQRIPSRSTRPDSSSRPSAETTSLSERPAERASASTVAVARAGRASRTTAASPVRPSSSPEPAFPGAAAREASGSIRRRHRGAQPHPHRSGRSPRPGCVGARVPPPRPLSASRPPRPGDDDEQVDPVGSVRARCVPPRLLLMVPPVGAGRRPTAAGPARLGAVARHAGALRPLILVAPSFDASMSWKWRKRGAPARVGAAFIRVHPRRSTPPETGRTRRARTASACAGRSSQTASAVSGPVIDSRAAAVYSMSWTGLR